MPDLVRVTLKLPESEAMAMAQFAKRVSRSDCQRLAGDAAEADAMFDGLIMLKQALADAGYAPR